MVFLANWEKNPKLLVNILLESVFCTPEISAFLPSHKHRSLPTFYVTFLNFLRKKYVVKALLQKTFINVINK